MIASFVGAAMTWTWAWLMSERSVLSYAAIVWLPTLTTGAATQAAWRAALAAVPAALAVSGKPTVATFAVGLAAGLLLLDAPLRRRLWLFLWFGIGGTATTAACLGPWLAHVWAATGSPFYPDFARFFHSPFAGDGWNLDRWSTHGVREALAYPLVFATDSARVAEVPFTTTKSIARFKVRKPEPRRRSGERRLRPSPASWDVWPGGGSDRLADMSSGSRGRDRGGVLLSGR